MTSSTPRPSGLYAPRHWPVWLAMGLLWVVSRLPYRLAMALGDALGLISLPLSPWRRMIARTNLRLCFPEYAERERKRLLRQVFRYTGRGVVEIGISWWRSDREVRRLGEVRGLENLEAAQADGTGAIMVGGHFSCIEIAGRILGQAAPFNAIYRENKNPVLEHLTRLGRDRHFGAAIPRSDMRTLVRRLRAGERLWYPPDQDFGREHSVFVPLFGIPAATVTVPSRLAGMARARVVPVRYYARDDGRGYVVDIQPALENFPSGDAEADARRLNAFFEEEMRAHPAQYYWVHRRFKTRPPGEALFYPRKRRQKRKA